jgi:hypothetical protein
MAPKQIPWALGAGIATPFRRVVLALSLALTSALVACGGGGGSAGTPILNSGLPGSNPGLGPVEGGSTAVEVIYAVTGSAFTAEILYVAADGSDVAFTAALPWSVSILAEPGSPLAVTARNTAPTGALTVRIGTAGGTLRELTSSAPFAQVTVTATCCELPSQ